MDQFQVAIWPVGRLRIYDRALKDQDKALPKMQDALRQWGFRVPLLVTADGEVIDGGVTVNQSAITGESVAVNKTVGSRVYAGTVVESGECIIKVTQINGQGKYDRIVKMIEDSEKLKSSLESKASNLADRLVPFSVFGTIFTYAITRNVTKALSILMVDYSCALKLTMPVAVLSAINECSNYNATVKGGKYLEALSKANVIVFDKTGTLTKNKLTNMEKTPFCGRGLFDVVNVWTL